MRAIVDTNILIRIFTHDNLQESAKAEAFLKANDLIIPNQTLCEMVWVLRKLYKFGIAELRDAIQSLLNTERVTLDRGAVFSGLAFLDAGGDFADGVIAFEGRRLGGETFVTFDKKAASILSAAGQDCLLLNSN